MTWAEWKRWIEEHGVKDEDRIAYIDCSYPQDIDKEERGWAIY